MAHNIFGSRFLGHRQPAWHGLGETFDSPLGAPEAIRRAGLDYRVVRQPLTLTYQGAPVATDQVGIIREPVDDDPVPRLFAVASGRYAILQNAEVGDVLAPLTGDWPVETAGALGYGERIFLTLRIGAGEIAGDAVEEYFLCTNSHDGSSSVVLAYTPVRVVCQNTLTMALGQSSLQVKVEHEGAVKDMVAFQAKLMADLRTAQTGTRAALEALASLSLNADQVSDAINAAYPLPKGTGERRLLVQAREYPDLLARDGIRERLERSESRYQESRQRVLDLREAAVATYARFNDEQPAHARTGWAVYNAVAELADHRDGRGDVGLSALFGERALEKARCYASLRSLLN